MPINSRTKGATYERQVVGILNEFFLKNNFDITCKRNLDQYQTKDLADITIPFHALECKHYKEGNWLKADWWKQVCVSADNDGTIPVLIFKFNRVPTRVCIPLHAVNPEWEKDNQKVAVMSMDDWLDTLLKNWHKYEQLQE
tara:strand:+ start:362 stop:784 length:423 start_codon:yes stop_codon:yes gene_type:complete